MFKAHEKEIWEVAMGMATGEIPAKTAAEAKRY
jgi:hypothetical protein